ncbi:MAG TPA: DUF2203 domain-containing protein [Vicinamibacterales bacterium]
MASAPIHQITPCGDPRVFTLAEAEALFPLVRRITQSAYQELEPVRRALEAMVPTNPMIQDVERQYEMIVKRWVGKMERLGLVVKGLWLVDFDTGDGYLCWKFPELRIGYYHSYHEGYAGRVPLRQVVEEFDPDWAHA